MKLALICKSQTQCNKLPMVLFYTSNGLFFKYAALDLEQKWEKIYLRHLKCQDVGQLATGVK